MRFSKVYFVFKPFVIWEIIISWGLSKRDFDGSDFSDHRWVYTPNRLHAMQLPNPLSYKA